MTVRCYKKLDTAQNTQYIQNTKQNFSSVVTKVIRVSLQRYKPGKFSKEKAAEEKEITYMHAPYSPFTCFSITSLLFECPS